MKAKINKDEPFYKSFSCKYETEAGGFKKKSFNGFDIEVGQFKGLATTYGNADLVNDIVERGSLTKTLNDKGGKIGIRHQHNLQDILGGGILVDSHKGLEIAGDLNMAVKRAVEDFSLMKQGVLDKLSIGYNIIDAEYDQKGLLHLKELRLHEVSLVDNPANIDSVVMEVKSFNSNPAAFIEKRIMDLYRSLINVKDRGFNLRIDDSLLSNLSDEVKSLSKQDVGDAVPDLIHDAKAQAAKKEADNALLSKGLDGILTDLKTFTEVEQCQK